MLSIICDTVRYIHERLNIESPAPPQTPIPHPHQKKMSELAFKMTCMIHLYCFVKINGV